MKTLQELYQEIIKNDELKKAFLEAAKANKVTDFLKAQGCDATEKDIVAMLKEQSNKELTDEELDAVAGGCNSATEYEAIYSTITAGLLCVTWALNSATHGYVGQKDEKDGRLCNI